jgi:aryl-alcohol dehydrogenase-like predicted oxidoreductase
VASVLIGATSAEQLDANLSAADLDLSTEEIWALDSASATPPTYPQWFNQRFSDPDARKVLGY